MKLSQVVAYLSDKLEKAGDRDVFITVRRTERKHERLRLESMSGPAAQIGGGYSDRPIVLGCDLYNAQKRRRLAKKEGGAR